MPEPSLSWGNPVRKDNTDEELKFLDMFRESLLQKLEQHAGEPGSAYHLIGLGALCQYAVTGNKNALTAIQRIIAQNQRVKQSLVKLTEMPRDPDAEAARQVLNMLSQEG